MGVRVRVDGDHRLLKVSLHTIPGSSTPKHGHCVWGNFSVKSSPGLVDTLFSVAATQIMPL